MKAVIIITNTPARLFGGGLLIWSFTRIILIAGHGAGMVGALILSHPLESWLLPQLFGWAGCLLEVAALVTVSTRNWKLVAGLGAAAIFISTVLFLLASENLRYLDFDSTTFAPVLFALILSLRIAQVISTKAKSD